MISTYNSNGKWLHLRGRISQPTVKVNVRNKGKCSTRTCRGLRMERPFCANNPLKQTSRSILSLSRGHQMPCTCSKYLQWVISYIVQVLPSTVDSWNVQDWPDSNIHSPWHWISMSSNFTFQKTEIWKENHRRLRNVIWLITFALASLPPAFGQILSLKEGWRGPLNLTPLPARASLPAQWLRERYPCLDYELRSSRPKSQNAFWYFSFPP